VLISNEASGMVRAVDVEMSEVSVLACPILWSLSNPVSLYPQFISRRAASVRHELKAPTSVKDPLARARSIRGKILN
jgi:hypothetical protein